LTLVISVAILLAASGFVASAQTFQTLYDFTGYSGLHGIPAYGPVSLTLGNDGNFYGTTDVNDGLFKMTTNGVVTTLVMGEVPNSLTLGIDGNFYGIYGPPGEGPLSGTLVRVTTSGLITVLVTNDQFSFYYGQNALTLGKDGSFYGTTRQGGDYNNGSVFKVTTTGVFTTLLSFNITNGAGPNALTLGNDGNFYGTASEGFNGFGSLFKVTSNGVLTTLAVFNFTNGANPTVAMTLGNDGNLYGTTSQGGITNSAFIYGMGTQPSHRI